MDVDNYSPLAIDPGNEEGESPRNQFFLHSSHDLGCNWELDLVGRYTDAIHSQSIISSYLDLDTRLSWRPSQQFEFAIIGRNLLDRSHREFFDDAINGVLSTEIEREVYGVATWRY